MCSEQTRFSNLSRRRTVGNVIFPTCTICLWLILPAPPQVMQAAILWCNFKGKGLVSSWHPSHTRYHAHPRDIPHEHASLWLKGSHARMQTAWLWVEFLCLCMWFCCREGNKMAGVDRSSPWQSFILAAELLNLKEIALENCPRCWLKTTLVLRALGGSSPTFYFQLATPRLQQTTFYLIKPFPKAPFSDRKARSNALSSRIHLQIQRYTYFQQIGHWLRLKKK